MSTQDRLDTDVATPRKYVVRLGQLEYDPENPPDPLPADEDIRKVGRRFEKDRTLFDEIYTLRDESAPHRPPPYTDDGGVSTPVSEGILGIKQGNLFPPEDFVELRVNAIPFLFSQATTVDDEWQWRLPANFIPWTTAHDRAFLTVSLREGIARLPILREGFGRRGEIAIPEKWDIRRPLVREMRKLGWRVERKPKGMELRFPKGAFGVDYLLPWEYLEQRRLRPRPAMDAALRSVVRDDVNRALDEFGWPRRIVPPPLDNGRRQR